jgi:ankyrin repeat protein
MQALVLAIVLSQAASALPAGAGADADGLTPLMRAAARGDVNAVTALVAAGADVNGTHAELRLSPLMFAAYFGHGPVVRALLDAGARANHKDTAGASAADWATAGDQAATADTLTRAGAQLNPFLNVGVMPFALMDKAALPR